MTRHEFEERSNDVTSTQKVAVITEGAVDWVATWCCI